MCEQRKEQMSPQLAAEGDEKEQRITLHHGGEGKGVRGRMERQVGCLGGWRDCD